MALSCLPVRSATSATHCGAWRKAAKSRSLTVVVALFLSGSMPSEGTAKIWIHWGLAAHCEGLR